jgi:hypothetical protein
MAVHPTRIGSFELPAEDLDRAAAFYRRVFGWRAERVPWAGPPYLVLRPPAAAGDATTGALGGGLYLRHELGAPHPLLMLHLAAGRLEDCLAAITTHGGTVDQVPRTVGSFGRFARFRDPEGNLLGLWEPAVPRP